MTVKKRKGRPLKFESVEELEKKINEYFESCFEEKWFDECKRDENGNKIKKNGVYETIPIRKKIQIEPITITGLAVALDTSRRTLLDYEDEVQSSIDEKIRANFSHTIKKAKDFIEYNLEKGMLKGEIPQVAGIFNAKNNFGWTDRQEIDHTTDGKQIGGFNYIKPE